jgi:hypothetical protein
MRPCSLIQTPVGEHGVSQWPDLFCRLNRFLRQIRFLVDIAHRIDPRPGIFGSAGILRHRDDFKILVSQLLVDCLPAWQVKAASSPTGPRDKQNFLPAKIREPMQLAMQVRQREVRRLQ